MKASAESTSILQDLYAHGDWANAKLLNLCGHLTDSQLNQPREMGFGSLRNTFFHILEAESLWMERWLGQPARPLVADAGGLSLVEIGNQMQQVALSRDALIAQELRSDFARVVTFVDLAGNQWQFPIGDLLNHVANHGIHHRAQVLSFMKQFGITVPAGVDYIFWKMSRPSTDMPDESVAALRKYGLEANVAPGKQPTWDAARIACYQAYDNWAFGTIFDIFSTMSDTQLDRELNMGMGSLRKNLQHMLDANRWWLANWKQDGSPFPRGEAARSLEEMRAQFDDIVSRRATFVNSLDAQSASRIVSVTAGGPITCFRVTESLIQLFGHGTHHRAQCLNMARQLGVQPLQLDLVQWLRTNAANH